MVDDRDTTDAPAKKREVLTTPVSRVEKIGQILEKLETHLLGADAAKGTVGDYLRLIQVMKEMGEERPREIEIRWVNSLREESDR